jgi:hypothetical protein
LLGLAKGRLAAVERGDGLIATRRIRQFGPMISAAGPERTGRSSVARYSWVGAVLAAGYTDAP